MYYYLFLNQGIFVFGTLGIALVVDQLDVVLGLVGATSATIVQYILPGLSYTVLFPTDEDGPSWKRYLAHLLYVMGMVICPVCCVFIFL